MGQGLDAKRHFVTGGAGFIGSHVTDRLLAEGNFVTVCDNLSSGQSRWIEHHFGKKEFAFVEADLLDCRTLARAMRGHDIVWHLGANTDIPGGSEDTSIDLYNCTIATRNVLEAMRANGIDKIIFSSSATVYGEISVRPTPEDAGPLLPISLYGAGKLACEGLISAYCHLFGMRAWIFRFANVVGDRMGHGVIWDFIQKLKKNPEELEILGDGRQEKPFFLVEDCIDGMLCASRNSHAQWEVYNLGCTTTTTVDRVAEIVVEEAGLSPVEFRYTGGRRGFPGDVPQLRFDVSKMRRLGWEARHTSDGAVRIAARRLLERARLGAAQKASSG